MGPSHRDYLAAHAPQDVCNNIMGNNVQDIAEFLDMDPDDYVDDFHYLAAYTKAAYIYADAMIETSKGIP